MPEVKSSLLSSRKRRKKNRRLNEVCDVLRAFGFSERKASKENSVWHRGSVTLTLPNPHGGDRVLKTPYVNMVVREIERAESIPAASGENEDEE